MLYVRSAKNRHFNHQKWLYVYLFYTAGSKEDIWQEANLTIPKEPFQLVFKGSGGKICLDNVSVRETPCVVKPGNRIVLTLSPQLTN